MKKDEDGERNKYEYFEKFESWIEWNWVTDIFFIKLFGELKKCVKMSLFQSEFDKTTFLRESNAWFWKLITIQLCQTLKRILIHFEGENIKKTLSITKITNRHPYHITQSLVSPKSPNITFSHKYPYRVKSNPISSCQLLFLPLAWTTPIGRRCTRCWRLRFQTCHPLICTCISRFSPRWPFFRYSSICWFR